MRKLLSFALVSFAFFPQATAAQITQQEYAARRTRLAAKMDSTSGGKDWTLYVSGAREPAHDYESFYQNPRLDYLTGFHEPDAALVMRRRSAAVREILFVQPREPDREVWTGKRLGPLGVQGALGMEGRDERQLVAALDTIVGRDSTLYVAGDLNDADSTLTNDDVLVRRLKRTHSALRGIAANRVVDDLRRLKSPAELDLIRKAVAITVDAQHAAFQLVRPGINEFEVQALIEYTFRKNGADRPSFSTIVGSGPNSTALHYNADDRFIDPGDVVVMDIGASYRGYAADVTRTVPANGTFSPAQREIYQAVRDAQAAGERQATLGNDSRRMSDSATKSISTALARFGLIEGADSTYDCSDDGATHCMQYRLYYMHGLGHPIGLEVHDVGLPGRPAGRLGVGDVFTIEPGIYVRGNLIDIIPDTPRNRRIKGHIRTAVARYANIGVRIEDDYIMTDNGVEWISTAPRELEDVEALMKTAPANMIRRDSTKVEWYRLTSPRGSYAP